MTVDNNKAFKTQLQITAIISIMEFKIELIQHQWPRDGGEKSETHPNRVYFEVQVCLQFLTKHRLRNLFYDLISPNSICSEARQ